MAAPTINRLEGETDEAFHERHWDVSPTLDGRCGVCYPPTPGPFPISRFVGTLDSHTVYDAQWVNDQLRSAGYQGMPIRGISRNDTLAAMRARGLGGYMEKQQYKGQRYITGHVVAAHVARHVAFAGQMLRGDSLMGRGSAHRAYLQDIRDSEQRATEDATAATT